MQYVITVFKKELRDMFRDKRVRRTIFIMPIFTVLLVVMLFGFLDNVTSKPSSIKIDYVHGTPQEVVTALQAGKVSLEEVPSVEEGNRLIQAGKARMVLDVAPNPKAPGTYLAELHFDSKQESSVIASKVSEQILDALNKALALQALSANGIPASTLTKYQPKEDDVLVGGKTGASSFAISIMPYLIIMWAFYGGISFATELVAGEKDKNTLETLLISPATRSQIAMGKFLSLAVICLTCSCMSVVALGIAPYLSSGNKMFALDMSLTPLSGLLILLVMLPTVGLFASLLLAISSYAKNPREAQGYLAGISTLVVMPAMFSQFIGYTDYASKTWIYAIPVLNAAVNLRQILQAQFNPLGFTITLVISLVLAGIGIRTAVWFFNRESVLARV